ncbi:MAG: hypothetical protein V3T90_00275 [Anaerolineae bacterium]
MRVRRLLIWLDTRRLATAILFVAVFAMAVRAPADSDTWWHLKAGQVTVERGRILQEDLFSHTRYGSPWINHSWLSQVVLYWLFDRFSYAGLGLWMAAVVVAAFAFVYLQMEGDVFTRAFIVILAAATSGVIWSARPQLFSFLLTAVVAYLLYLFKWRRINRLWLLPPLFILWVNLHAGYALGFIILLGFVAGEVLNNLLALVPSAGSGHRSPGDDSIVGWKGIGMVILFSLLSVLLLVLNPNTTRMWVYPFQTARIQILQQFIQEWQSPDFHPLHTQTFIWMLLATLAAVGLSGRRVDGSDLVLTGGLAYAALLAGRNIAPFALVAAPTLSRHVAVAVQRWSGAARARGWLGTPRRRAPTPALGAVNWGLLVLIVALAGVKVYLPLRPGFNEALQRESLPVGAIEWIQANPPQGRMFNHYNWGGYLVWRLWPDYRVFVDGRTYLYGDEILYDYVEIQAPGPHCEELLGEYEVSFVVTRAGDALSVVLGRTPGWRLVYEDVMAVIYVWVER